MKPVPVSVVTVSLSDTFAEIAVAVENARKMSPQRSKRYALAELAYARAMITRAEQVLRGELRDADVRQTPTRNTEDA